MPASIRRSSYYYLMVKNQPGEAYKLLSALASGDVQLLGFNTVPVGPDRTQLVVFPDDEDRLLRVGREAGFVLDGPHHALLVQGDDELGALVSIHGRLSDAGINVYAAHGVADGQGGFGYVIHVHPADFKRAADLLGAR